MAAEDFLSEACVAGQALLRLASKGNAIIAELLRLADHIPAPFTLPAEPKKSSTSQGKRYSEIIFDFRYLKNGDLYEHRIENSEELRDLDNEFREAHMTILKRFYQLFESIYKYVIEILKYFEDLEDGVYIQQTLEVGAFKLSLVQKQAHCKWDSFSL